MDSSGDTCAFNNFQLENGIILPKVDIRYKTYGKLNENRDNTMVFIIIIRLFVMH